MVATTMVVRISLLLQNIGRIIRSISSSMFGFSMSPIDVSAQRIVANVATTTNSTTNFMIDSET